MQTIRDLAIDAFQKLPPDATAEDLQYQLYVLEKIRKSEDAIAQQGVVTQEQARERMKRWLVR